MAKRIAEDFNYLNNCSKKQKIDDLVLTEWNDDFDDDILLEAASQLLDKEENTSKQFQQNESILPSYDSFRPNIPFASTQEQTSTMINNKHQSFKNNDLETKDNLKIKVAHLQQLLDSKNGEAAILRSQMQRLKTEMSEDHNKKYKEYLTNLNLKDKEIMSIKDQLKFKNLEIANLKQSVSEISKANVPVTSCTNINKRLRFESVSNKTVFSSKDDDTSSKFKEILIGIRTMFLKQTEFPLISKLNSNFCEVLPPELHNIENRINPFGRNSLLHRHNKEAKEEFIVPLGPKIVIKFNKKEVGLEYFYPLMLKMIQSNIDEINSESNESDINTILYISFQFLNHFKQYLGQLEKCYRTEDIELLDKNFLQNCYNELNVNSEDRTPRHGEVGIRAGKTVHFMAELLQYSSYLQNFIIQNKNLKFNKEDSDSETSNQDVNGYNYISLLNTIVRKIFFLRKTEICRYFLSSVAIFLMNISKCDLNENINEIFGTLTGSLLFTRPPTDVLLKILIIFKNMSKSRIFMNFLCLKPESEKFKTDKKRKLLYFTEDSCKFTLFFALFNNALKNIEDEKLNLSIGISILSFVYNIFINNPSWMDYEQKTQCLCLQNLYQLTIEVSYKIVLRFMRNKSNNVLLKEMYFSIFRSIVKIFGLLVFNSYTLMENSTESYSKYREICDKLLELQSEFNFIAQKDDLERLNVLEEVPCLHNSKLDLL